MTMPRSDRERLAQLRHEWQTWRRGRHPELHDGYCLAPCAEQCGTCEGCCATAYRAERMAEIEAEAADVKALHLLRTELGAVVLDTTERTTP